MTELKKIQEDLRLFLQEDRESREVYRKLEETLGALNDYIANQKVSCGCTCEKGNEYSDS